MRNVGSRAIGLTNDQEIIATRMGPTDYLDLGARSRMIGVMNANKLCELFAGSM